MKVEDGKHAMPSAAKQLEDMKAAFARRKERQQKKELAIALRELDCEVRFHKNEEIEQSLSGNNGEGLKDLTGMPDATAKLMLNSQPVGRRRFRSSFLPIAEEFQDSHLHERPSRARPPLSDPRNCNWSEEQFSVFFQAEEQKESKRKAHLRRIRKVAEMSASESSRAFKGSSLSSFKRSIKNLFIE
jgi:hypothetical protein